MSIGLDQCLESILQQKPKKQNITSYIKLKQQQEKAVSISQNIQESEVQSFIEQVTVNKSNFTDNQPEIEFQDDYDIQESFKFIQRNQFLIDKQKEKQNSFSEFMARNELLLLKKYQPKEEHYSFQPTINTFKGNKPPITEYKKTQLTQEKFSFKPTINPSSHTVQKVPVTNYKYFQEKQKVQEPQLEHFQLQIHSKNAKSVLKTQNVLEIARELKEKREEIHKKKTQLELEKETEGCTFKPKIRKTNLFWQ